VKKVTFLIIPALAILSACDEGLQPVPFQGVSGRVAFLGEVPDSTDWVRVAAFVDLPQTEIDLLGFSAISNELLLPSDSTPYVLGLDTGVYRWLPIVWKRSGAALTPDALRILGWYTDGAGPFDPPQTLLVREDTETTNADMIADFENALTVEEALEALK